MTMLTPTYPKNQAPSDVPTFYAAKLAGVVFDCDFDTKAKVGGGTPTPAATALNNWITSQTAPFNLVFDGSQGVPYMDKPLAIPNIDGCTIDGVNGGGLVMADGANASAIQNFPDTDLAEYDVWNPSVTRPMVLKNLTIRNLRINGNRPGNCDGTPDGTLTGQANTTGNPRGPYANVYWLSGIVLTGVDGLVIENVTVYDAPTYHINLYKCKNVHIRDCTLAVPDPAQQNNTDGIHLNDGCTNVWVDGCNISTGDDGIGANLNEGGGTSGGYLYVTNCRFDALTVCRIYGKNSTVLDKVIFSNISGSVQWYGVVVGEGGGPDSGNESNRDILLHNWRVNVLGLAGRTDHALVLVSGNVGLFTLDDVVFAQPTFACPIVRMDANSPFISALRMVNCGVHRSAAGNAACWALEASTSGSIIGDIDVDFSVTEYVNAGFADIPVLVNMAGSGFKDMSIEVRATGVQDIVRLANPTTFGNGIKLRHVEHYSNAGSAAGYAVVTTASGTVPVFVGPYARRNTLGVASGSVSLSGPGLASSGFAFADTLVADGSIYRSSTQSALCYKFGGVASPFTMGTPAAASGAASAANFDGQANTTGLGDQFYANGTPLTHASAAAFQAPAANGPFTVFAWYKPETLPQYGSILSPVLSKYDSGSNEWILGRFNGPNKFGFEMNGGHEVDGTTTPSLDTWYFLSGVYDGTAIHLFVNATEEGTPVATTSLVGTADCRIGGAANNSQWRANGPIACVGKFDYALSGTELTWLYNAGHGRNAAEVLAHSWTSAPKCLYTFENPGNLGLDSGAGTLNMTNAYTTGPTQAAGPA